MKRVLLIRGAPGAGKTKLAEMFAGAEVCLPNSNSAIDLALCREQFLQLLYNGSPCVIVDSRNLTRGARDFFVDNAKLFNYEVSSIIVERLHDGAKNAEDLAMIETLRNNLDL